MFYCMLIFLVLSIITGILGYGDFSNITVRHLGKTSFGTFIILFFIMFIFYILERKNNK